LLDLFINSFLTNLEKSMSTNSFIHTVLSLNLVEKEYGLSQIDSGERAVFDAIVRYHSEGKAPAPSDLLTENIASRSSVYRHIARLKTIGLIKEKWHEGRCLLILSQRVEEMAERVSLIRSSFGSSPQIGPSPQMNAASL
jgi:predicted transcriptional regulator